MYSAAKGQGVFRLIVKQQHYVLWARRTQCQRWRFRNCCFFSSRLCNWGLRG